MKKLFTILNLLFATSVLYAQNLQPWKLNLGAGQSYTITSTLQTNLSQNMMGQEMKMGNAATTTTKLSVLSADAQGYKVTHTTNRMQLNMNMNTPMGNQDLSFDSDKKEDREGDLGQRMGALIGATTEAVISPAGNLTITKAAELDAEVNLSELGVGAGDSAALKSFFLTPPPAAIKVGDTWKESSNTENLKADITYRYLRSETGVAYVQYEQSVTTKQTINTNGMEVQSSQTIIGEGTLQVELSSGLVLQRNFDGKLKGKSEVMGMEIPQEGTQKITVLMKRN